MARKVKLRKREIAFAIGVGALASLAAAGILSDGFGGPGSSFRDDPSPKTAAVSPSSQN
jgi:hypothetical protein